MKKKKNAQMPISVFDRVENIVANEGNAGYQHFLLLPQWFQKSFSGKWGAGRKA